MKKTIFIFTLIVSGIAAITNAATINIPADYNNIQTAIDAADPCDTINIAAGDYAQSLLVNKANLIFIGPNADIAGYEQRVAEANIIGYVKIMASGITLDGLHIIDGEPVPAGENAGVYIVGGTNGHTIINNLFTRTGLAPSGGDTYRALINEFGGVSSLEVRSNKFVGWHTGVYLQNADAAVIDNVMLENYVGMSIDGATSVTVEDNSFIDNGYEGLGIGPPPVTSLTITGNCFIGNTAGISNWQDVELDARNNSFADASGPYNPTSNPDGLGDSVSDNIIYETWLAACCGDPLHQPPLGDLIVNCRVDFYDFSVLVLAWLAEQGDANWNADTNLDATDDIIDENDLEIFVQHWLDCTDSDCD